MGYESGKIYKLQCSDGRFYIGSTINKLNVRFYHHKTASKHKNTPFYSHIQTIGWENVSIMLLEEFSCKNKTELCRRENEIIEKQRENPMCLNKNKAMIEEHDKETYMKEYHKVYNDTNKEYIAAQKKEYKLKNKEIIREKAREYYQKNKERISLQQKEYHARKNGIISA